MVAMYRALIGVGPRFDGAEAQGVHDGQRPRAHGKDVAQDSPHARRSTLKRLDKRWVIVRLDLEGTSPAVADIDDPGILSRPLHHAAAASGEPLQMHAGRLIRAVLAPHDAENAEFRQRRFAAQGSFDLFVLFRRDSVLFDNGGSNGGCLGSGHVGRSIFACRSPTR